MGIKNLLRFLKPFIAPVHIKKYSGKRVRISWNPFSITILHFFFQFFWSIFDEQVGVDAYSWLHKGGEEKLQFL